MISSKILMQSAAAGLMAGAILSMPLFVVTPDEDASQLPSGAQAHNPDISYGPHEQPTLRAAPPLAFERARMEQARTQQQTRKQNVRTLEERNEAAQRMLGELNDAYDGAQAEQAAIDAAHSFTVRTMATQAAYRVRNGTYTRSDGQLTAARIAAAAMASNQDRLVREFMRKQGPLASEQQ